MRIELVTRVKPVWRGDAIPPASQKSVDGGFVKNATRFAVFVVDTKFQKSPLTPEVDDVLTTANVVHVLVSEK
jgi:hypothetical protein